MTGKEKPNWRSIWVSRKSWYHRNWRNRMIQTQWSTLLNKIDGSRENKKIDYANKRLLNIFKTVSLMLSGSCFVASWEVIWDKEPGNVHKETIRSFAVNLRKIIVWENFLWILTSLFACFVKFWMKKNV